MTGTGLEACETTQDVDYSNVTPNAEWSISMCYLNAYLPTVSSKEYQAVDVLVDLTPSETAQVQMFTAPGTLFYSDAASCQGDYVQDWVFNGPTDPTYDDVQDFFADYQADLEDYILTIMIDPYKTVRLGDRRRGGCRNDPVSPTFFLSKIGGALHQKLEGRAVS